jgi:hypothetical protein
MLPFLYIYGECRDNKELPRSSDVGDMVHTTLMRYYMIREELAHLRIMCYSFSFIRQFQIYYS